MIKTTNLNKFYEFEFCMDLKIYQINRYNQILKEFGVKIKKTADRKTIAELVNEEIRNLYYGKYGIDHNVLPDKIGYAIKRFAKVGRLISDKYLVDESDVDIFKGYSRYKPDKQKQLEEKPEDSKKEEPKKRKSRFSDIKRRYIGPGIIINNKNECGTVDLDTPALIELNVSNTTLFLGRTKKDQIIYNGSETFNSINKTLYKITFKKDGQLYLPDNYHHINTKINANSSFIKGNVVNDVHFFLDKTDIDLSLFGDIYLKVLGQESDYFLNIKGMLSYRELDKISFYPDKDYFIKRPKKRMVITTSKTSRPKPNIHIQYSKK